MIFSVPQWAKPILYNLFWGVGFPIDEEPKKVKAIWLLEPEGLSFCGFLPGPPKVCFLEVFRYLKPTKKHSFGGPGRLLHFVLLAFSASMLFGLLLEHSREAMYREAKRFAVSEETDESRSNGKMNLKETIDVRKKNFEKAKKQRYCIKIMENQRNQIEISQETQIEKQETPPVSNGSSSNGSKLRSESDVLRLMDLPMLAFGAPSRRKISRVGFLLPFNDFLELFFAFLVFWSF